MRFERLLEIVGDEPVFETGLLLAGDVDPADMRRRLAHWTETGRLYRLRRDLYTLAPPFQRMEPHPFLVANHLVLGSYVSLRSALAYYGFIPEHEPVVASVTTARPARWHTPLGRDGPPGRLYEFRHIRPDLQGGYRLIELSGGQRAFVALPEKALLDLVYLQPGGDSLDYLEELRLRKLDRLDLDELQRQVDLADSPKLRRTATLLTDLARSKGITPKPK